MYVLDSTLQQDIVVLQGPAKRLPMIRKHEGPASTVPHQGHVRREDDWELGRAVAG